MIDNTQNRVIREFAIIAKDFKNVDKFGIKIISPKRLLEEIKWEH